MADTNTQTGNGNLDSFTTQRYDDGSCLFNFNRKKIVYCLYLKFDGFEVRTPYPAFDQLHLTPHRYTVQDECLEEKKIRNHFEKCKSKKTLIIYFSICIMLYINFQNFKENLSSYR